MRHAGNGCYEGEPLTGGSEPNEDQSVKSDDEAHDPASSGEPMVRRVIKIDFDDDEAVKAFTK